MQGADVEKDMRKKGEAEKKSMEKRNGEKKKCRKRRMQYKGRKAGENEWRCE